MCSVAGQIYTDWANHYLSRSGHKRLVRDLQHDVTDGVLLAEIIQVVGKDKPLISRDHWQYFCFSCLLLGNYWVLVFKNFWLDV